MLIRKLTVPSVVIGIMLAVVARADESTMASELKWATQSFKENSTQEQLPNVKVEEKADHVLVTASDKICVNEKQEWQTHQSELLKEDLSKDLKESIQATVDEAYNEYEKCLAAELKIDVATPVQIKASEGSKESFWKKRPLNRNIYFASGLLMTIEIANVAIMAQAPSSVTGWHGRAPDFRNIKRSFTVGPRIDQDHWYWNYLGHPINGAEYYLLARNRGLKWWQSFLFSAGQSTFWEFGPEAVYERASIQDLIITPLAGSLIGEGRYQLKKLLVDRSTGKPNKTWKKILLVIVDPVDALSGGLKAGYHPAEWRNKESVAQ